VALRNDFAKPIEACGSNHGANPEKGRFTLRYRVPDAISLHKKSRTPPGLGAAPYPNLILFGWKKYVRRIA
jgi:hypothetical protein